MEQKLSADYSRAINEPLYGTMKPAKVWFLLEYNGLYSHDAWGDARIPQDVKAKLESFPKSRQLLIRQPNQVNAIDRQVSLIVVNAAAEKPHYFHLYLKQYEDILGLDFDALLAGKLIAAETEALFLVCTNGKRDACCAAYGTALYMALVNEAATVWQSSHIGGHRFAGTLLCFPHAIAYGFLTENDADMLVKSYHREELILNKLRGHAIYPQHVQVAEYYLRRHLNIESFDALKLLQHEETEGNCCVQFAVNGTPYEVSLTSAEPLMVLSTSGDDKLSPVPQYKLLEIKPL